ncbi:5291_t:CDS:2 [Acaulospora morrowiae]|uniref:5291_t:CDS:1 n=1 Tax=Acaulospora morrowiae TaxID=94023 RepID=A0A9N8YXS7_9GLOM|nr:5291_t:CDS:2 [Acaulospora morrowiae]
MDLLVAADELVLTELVNYLKDFFLESYYKWICQHPLQVLYHNVFRLESCKELRELCLTVVCENPTLVFGTTAFSAIDEPVLISILQRDDLQMEEIEIWDYLTQWGIARTQNLDADISKWSDSDFSELKSTLQNFIPLVKFDHISPNEIPLRLSPFNKILLSYDDKSMQEECSIFKTLIDSTIIRLKHASLISRWIDLKEDKTQHSGMALFGADVRGPCFGNRDLWMSNFNNLSRQCSSQVSYYDKSIIDSRNFDVEDYEVFQIFKKNISKEVQNFSS